MTEDKKPRGFATLTPEQRTAMARRGGQSVKPESRTFKTQAGLASKAGKKGGLAPKKDRKT